MKPEVFETIIQTPLIALGNLPPRPPFLYEEGRLVAYNLCRWYDGTLRPAKGHKAICEWRFDGQVWFHL